MNWKYFATWDNKLTFQKKRHLKAKWKVLANNAYFWRVIYWQPKKCEIISTILIYLAFISHAFQNPYMYERSIASKSTCLYCKCDTGAICWFDLNKLSTKQHTHFTTSIYFYESDHVQVNCRLKGNCTIKFELLCHLLAELAQIPANIHFKI